MKLYRPRFVIATQQTTPQTKLRSKLGGMPWGFPISPWPYCRECSRPMALVAQLLHEPRMLDLGDDNHVLHLFQCPTAGCSSYEFDAGCTAGLILGKHELGSSLTEAPRDTHPTGQIYVKMTGRNITAPEEKWEIPLNGELWLSHWEEHEDNIPPDKLCAFFNEAAFHELPADQRNPFGFRPEWNTKTGSAPYWGGKGGIFAGERIPQPPYAFLMQICDAVSVADLPVLPEDIAGFEITREDGKEYWVKFANFGYGSAYVFIDRHRDPPSVIWFWSN